MDELPTRKLPWDWCHEVWEENEEMFSIPLLGEEGIILLFTILTSSNCTLTSFNVSHNRLEDRVLRACPREHRVVVLHAIPPISVKLCQFEGSTPKLKKTNWFPFWFFPGGDRAPPPVFLGFQQGNRFKIGKMYGALTAMVFNQLL